MFQKKQPLLYRNHVTVHVFSLVYLQKNGANNENDDIPAKHSILHTYDLHIRNQTNLWKCRQRPENSDQVGVSFQPGILSMFVQFLPCQESNIIQLSTLQECDMTDCLPEKDYVTQVQDFVPYYCHIVKTTKYLSGKCIPYVRLVSIPVKNVSWYCILVRVIYYVSPSNEGRHIVLV